MTQIISIKEQQIKNLLKKDSLFLSELRDNVIRKSATKIDFTQIENDTARQEFRDLLFLVFAKDIPYKHTSDSIYHVLRLAGFMKSLNGITQIRDEKLQEMFHLYCKKHNFGADNKKIILTCKNALLDYYDKRENFDRDVWDKSILKLPDERINKSGSYHSLNFRRIENIENRELVKTYFRFLIGGTELAFPTITNIHSQICCFCDYIDTKLLKDVTSQDIYDYLDENQELSASSYNKLVLAISDMYTYLLKKHKIETSNPVKAEMYRKDNYKFIGNLVDEFTILQIFGHLHKASLTYILIYLINYCTGMRISDVCQLKTDCLFDDGKDGYYIRVDNCQKMQKTTMNLIPKALYERIEEQIAVINNLDYDEVYLFPSEREPLRPYVAQTYRNNFKQLCKEWNIKNEDGSDYEYRTHAYRHKIATELHIEYKVPIITIQKAVLWHKEIQMSYHYIEKNFDFRKMNADKYFSQTDDVSLDEFMKGNLKSYILPNGFCGKSTKLEKCPAVDACLSCQYFKTSKRFLPIHRETLNKHKARLPIYEANGWIPNVLTTKRQIQELKELIKKLEEMEDTDGC